MLFSAYRRDDFSDPEGFVTQLGTILSDFPEEVVIYVTSPKTGLQRRSKWPPTISEVLTACEDHQEFLAKTRAPRLIAKQLAKPDWRDHAAGSMAKIFVPEGHNRYAGLVEWTSHADRALWKFGPSSDSRPGLWVSHQAWNDPQSTKAAAKSQGDENDAT